MQTDVSEYRNIPVIIDQGKVLFYLGPFDISSLVCVCYAVIVKVIMQFRRKEGSMQLATSSNKDS